MRVPALDRLRAAALVMMLLHHFVKWLVDGDPREIIPGWEGFVVTDLAAPAFTVAAGASAVLWATKRPTPGPSGRLSGVRVRTVVRRYGLLVPIGMLLQWAFTSNVPFDWGVLQTIGVAVVASTLLTMAMRSPRAIGVCTGVALVIGPLLEAALDGGSGRLVDIVAGVFPVVTYTGFSLFGAWGALLLRRDPDRGGHALAAGGALLVVTLVMIEAGMPPDRYPGGVAFVIPGLAGTLLLFGLLDRWSAMPAAFGNHTLGIFIAHYAVAWLLTQWGWRNTLEPETAVVVALGFVVLFALVAPRVPKLPWSPRTGWARTPSPARSTRLESAARV